MKKLINSADGAVNDTPAGSRTGRTHGALVTALTGMAAAHTARTVEGAQRPELARSRGARVDIPAPRRER